MSGNIRSAILAFWLTMLTSTVGSTLTLNYFANTRAAPMPTTLGESWGLLAGVWLGALAAGVLCWERRGAVMGVTVAVFVRLAFWGAFLPNTPDLWSALWGLVRLSGVPAYAVFILLAYGGGALLAAVGHGGISLFFDEPLIPENTPHWGLVAVVALLAPIIMLNLVMIRSLNATEGGAIVLLNTEWLILPQTNMIVAALVGFVFGGVYLSANRQSAAGNVFLGLVLHVGGMILLDGILASYDPYSRMRYDNQVSLLPFLFFWFGAPVVGGLAAFALHNLRDAFALEPAS